GGGLLPGECAGVVCACGALVAQPAAGPGQLPALRVERVFVRLAALVPAGLRAADPVQVVLVGEPGAVQVADVRPGDAGQVDAVVIPLEAELPAEVALERAAEPAELLAAAAEPAAEPAEPAAEAEVV